MLGPKLEVIGRTEVVFEGRKYVSFSGNDYHRLSSHPDVVRALIESLERYGINSAESRTTTGNHPLYLELEAEAAEFLGTESAATFSAGYMSTSLLLQAVAPDFTKSLVDEMAHSSVVEAAVGSGFEIIRYRHRDPEDLHKQLHEPDAAGYRPIILTDGVFASSGAIGPLERYVQVGRDYDAMILIDDAHGMAVVGGTGKGSWEESGAPREFVLQAGTLSKGFGAFGGIVAGSYELIDRVHACKGFVGGLLCRSRSPRRESRPFACSRSLRPESRCFRTG